MRDGAGSPIPREVRNVLKTLIRAGHEAWCVGGCVRDLLLGVPPQDWDVTTSALPEEVMALFPRRTIPTGLKHGTVTVRSGHQGVEVTTYRCDGEYEDHRRPSSVTFTGSLEEDLRRRDLTVNAMAFGLDGELRDPLGGREDLKKKILRSVGPPDERFQEDALRIMRTIRFAATLGFRIEPETGAAVRRQKELLREIAVERIQRDLLRLLAGQWAADVVREHVDTLGVFWPELLDLAAYEAPDGARSPWERTLRSLALSRQAGRALRIRDEESWTVLGCALLLHRIGEPEIPYVPYGEPFPGSADARRDLAEEMIRRLRCPRVFRERVSRLVGRQGSGTVWKERRIRRILGAVGETDLRLLLAMERAIRMERSEDLSDLDRAQGILDAVLARKDCLTLRDLRVNGRDLSGMGLKGRQIGSALERLLDQVLDGETPNERKALLRSANAMAKELRSVPEGST